MDRPTSVDDSVTPTPIPDGEDAPQKNMSEHQRSRNQHLTSPPSAVSFQLAIDRALHFLSHASNETLGACLVGLGATTYLVLGRVGLVIMGVASGVVLHATWDGIRGDHRDEQTKHAEREKRRETGLELAKRIWDWRSDESAVENVQDPVYSAHQELDFSSFGPETAEALRTFTNAVIKDYVYYWYGPTLPGEDQFPASCKRTLAAYILSLSTHVQRKRPADAFLDFVTNASSIVIVFLNELAAATNASPNSPVEDAIATYLKLKPDSSLSYILEQNSQSRKLADIAEDLLQAYLDPKAYNFPPVQRFLKEVLAQLVLGSTITLCSRPDWINEWIVYGLEESETASKVMDIVDAGVEGRDSVRSPELADQTLPQVRSKKEAPTVNPETPTREHRRHMSRAEEAMDEAMNEAKRLTQLMIEEDARLAREQDAGQTAVSSSDDVSDTTPAHGVATPTSSQSDRELRLEESDVQAGESTVVEPPVNGVPTAAPNNRQFMSFDQLKPPAQAEQQTPSVAERYQVPLTLHQANISIFDDSQPGERVSMKAKPVTEYLIQIEPHDSTYSGWMISRKYNDFEMLHEVLRRISVITGVVGFAEAHTTLPQWKGNTKVSLRKELETYLIDAAKHQPLAECEGMKRFLEKDQGLNKSPSAKGFGWPAPDAFGKLGGDMMNVLTKAPKQVAGGVAGGGKAVLGGVAGLVIGGKKTNSATAIAKEAQDVGTEVDSPSNRQTSSDVYLSPSTSTTQSQDSFAASEARPQLLRQLSSDTTASVDSRQPPISVRYSADIQRTGPSLHDSTPSLSASAGLQPMQEGGTSPVQPEVMNLPPPPSEMPADYDSPKRPTRPSEDTHFSASIDLSTDSPSKSNKSPHPTHAAKPPLTERETSVAVELMFAVISELYTLSSAWNFRRTLLTAAKSYLLRPGNPQLLAIRDLLQGSLIDANLSDTGLAALVLKLRENALPTEQELEVWKRDYPEKTPAQQEELRLKARRLLVSKGMPQALSSVMGAAASGEALGKVFDCLQVESVSRGLVFGLMLQMLRIVTH